MPLPVTLGEDTFTYVFGALGTTFAFVMIGMCDMFWNLGPHDDNRPTTYRPQQKSLFFTQMFSFLLHGSILGLLIFNYIDSWKNAKDNVFLVLMSIVLGLNLADFFYKSIMYTGKNKASPETKFALFMLQNLGFLGFVTATFSYAWVGTFADQDSTSRDVVLTSGIIVIFVFALGMLNFYRHNQVFSTSLEMVISSATKQLNVSKRSGVETKIYHEPHSVRGLNFKLTDDNPDTPLLLHAADRARHNPLPGVNADNWRVLKYKDNHYLCSPETASVCLQLQSKWTGNFNDLTNHSGDGMFYKMGIYVPPLKDSAYISLPPITEIEDTANYVGYDIFYNKVHGWAGGIGIMMSVHYMFPLVFTVYMFAWYSLYLQQFTAACLASAITLAVPLLGSVVGFAAQYWELFRWYFLIGWSVINVVNYIVANSFKYIRQESTWNVTDIPVQEFPEFATADLSLNILGYAWVAFAWSILGLAVVVLELVVKYCRNKKTTVAKKALAESNEKFTKEEVTGLLKPNDANLVRRAKYLSVKQ